MWKDTFLKDFPHVNKGDSHENSQMIVGYMGITHTTHAMVNNYQVDHYPTVLEKQIKLMEILYHY